MSIDRTEAVVKATAQEIADDDARAVEMGADPIPPDEVIVEPSPSDYVAPAYLTKTAPELVGAFGEMLVALRDLNARFAGNRTVEAQAYLSLTGDHEELEERFLGWCQRYFAIRGSLNRLNPSNGNDPWPLYLDCYREFDELFERRIVQRGTINSSVLNLSQQFMLSAFAAKMFAPDLKSYAEFGQDRFGSEAHRMCAHKRVGEFKTQCKAFTSFLQRIAQHLPAEYAPDAAPDWHTRVRAKVARGAEDLILFRYLLCVLDVSDTEKRQLPPDLWARFQWDVYHGGSIGAVLTSATPEPSTEPFTLHKLALRRDGWLCHRDYSWLRVDPDYKFDERRDELAVNWFILDTLTLPLYEAWDRLIPDPVVSRGCDPDATDEEQTAALAVVLAEVDAVEDATAVTKRPRLPRLRLTRIKQILSKHFDCEWSPAKGSEQKVYRHGAKYFKLGCHGVDRTIYPNQLRECLVRLGIPLAEFLEVCR